MDAAKEKELRPIILNCIINLINTVPFDLDVTEAVYEVINPRDEDTDIDELVTNMIDGVVKILEDLQKGLK